jgi:hypothetical protein
MMMPGEVRVVHSWQLRATTTMVESYDCDSRSNPPELLNRHQHPPIPTRIQLLGSLASEVEVRGC